MGQHSYNLVSLSSLICALLPLSKPLFMNKPVVCGALKIWGQFRSRFIVNNSRLQFWVILCSLIIGSAFQLRVRKGVSCMKDL